MPQMSGEEGHAAMDTCTNKQTHIQYIDRQTSNNQTTKARCRSKQRTYGSRGNRWGFVTTVR